VFRPDGREPGAEDACIAPRVCVVPRKGFRAARLGVRVVSAGPVIGRAWSVSTTSADLACAVRFSDMRGIPIFPVVKRETNLVPPNRVRFLRAVRSSNGTAETGPVPQLLGLLETGNY